MGIALRFKAGEASRAVYDDEFAELFKKLGYQPPTRASHVEPIETGSNAWRWLVDMSPLGEKYQFCLWPPASSREEALKAEHDFILANWIGKI